MATSLLSALFVATTLVPPVLFAQAAPAVPSPAAAHIAAARQQLATDPRHIESYPDLVTALIRRSRETGDSGYLQQAEAALHAATELAPKDFAIRKAGVALLLANGRLSEALAGAQVLNKANPDDVTVYSYLAQTDLALGDYPAAEQAAQWMLNLRPNNTPGLLLGAELRVVYGDPAGALDFLGQAFGQTPATEPEEQAAIANRIAEVQLSTGALDAAGRTLARGETCFPGAPYLRQTRASLDWEQHRLPEAIASLEALARDEGATPDAHTLFLLGSTELAAGHKAEAEATFARFVAVASEAAKTPENNAADLILYLAGLPGEAPRDPARALELARAQAAKRQDIWTLDALAWALAAHGEVAEAQEAIAKALAPGIHSAQVDEHAGAIARAAGKLDLAAQRFGAAVAADGSSPYAAEARRQLPSSSQAAAVPAKAAVEPLASPVASAAPVPRPSEEAALGLLPDEGPLPAALLVPHATGTERLIHKMQGQVQARPDDAAAYAGLGAAYAQRARETGDVEDYALAEEALTKSLNLQSMDMAAAVPLTTMAEVCMGEHRFADALDYAQRALALGAGDLSPFAIVGDAHADRGEYEKAGAAYARLTAAGGNTPLAYAQAARTAYLQFLAGDTGGAIAAMEQAVREGTAAHLPGENLAWLYYELGEFHWQAGEPSVAASAYRTALAVYPGNYRALASLARVRASQGRSAEAIPLYQAAIAVVPMPAFIAELGDLYAATGKPGEADKQYKLVEYIGRLGRINQVLHNRDLALFYADHDRNLPEALLLAHKEFEVRSDVYTWDALAWALYKNAQYPQAHEAAEKALRLHTRDALLLFHAGMISAKLGHRAEATEELGEALTINPHFHPLGAVLAAEELASLRRGAELAGVPSVAAAKADAPGASR